MDLKSGVTFLRTCWILLLNFYWIDQYTATGTFGTPYEEKRISGCPKPCVCKSSFKVECIGKNLTKIPENIPATTTYLDLSSNKISVLPDLKRFRNLEELLLAGNLLSNLSDSTFYGLTRLHKLHLQGNKFKQVPEGAFQSLLGIKDLYFDANEITHVPENSFRNMRRLKHLRLDANYLTDVPVKALSHIRSLKALDLSTNRIKSIPNFAFRNLSNLIVLMLHDNQISVIADHAFERLNVLEVLDLQANEVKRIPTALIPLTDLLDLNIGDNDIEYIPDNSFSGNKKLRLLRLKNNPIKSVEKNAFRGLPNLNDLILSEVSNMEHFPDLNGTYNLRTIRFDRASIQSIPEDLCHKVFHLQTLDMHSNNIQKLPNLSRCTSLKILNLGNNEITTLNEGLFSNVNELRDLTISHNKITHISSNAFIGLGKLEYLDLSHNKIADIKDDAFVPVQSLKDLNLGENDFPHLPTRGLGNLEHLKTFHNKNLQERIPANQLPNVQTLVLSYAYHCCDFTQNSKKQQKANVEISENVEWLKPDFSDTFNDSIMEDNGNFTGSDSISRGIEQHLKDQEIFYDNAIMHEYVVPDYVETEAQSDNEVVNIAPISCEPMPGPFLPCDELFGWWSLRCGVWIVFLLALLGNGIVLFVSISGRAKMDVPRFLICNLACADFCMGIYLGILAIVDASTLGEFEMHAIKWQKSPGCLVAGFLGIVASELSVFTLTIITMERFYAIKHAMRFNKRLSLKHAVYVMLGGWFFCLALASLPLFEISDYRKFAICLPFETGDRASLAYVCFIMFFNGVSFLIIVGCYTKMYVSIILGSQSWNSKDFRVAKRMALLVFTDFLCWAPIIFFSVTAALGKDLIGLNEAKVLTIFVLPLNSCANPFLYAIFTKQFKKDCVKLCKRIEESSISRSLTNSTGRRLSFGISTWRNSHLHSPFHTEKRGSCSNSVSASSSMGGVVNQTEDGGCQLFDRENYIVKEIAEDNSENENIVENTNTPINNESLQHSCSNLIQKSECECCHSKTRKLSVGPMGSDTQIVIHFDKKGNSQSTEKSVKDKKCVRCKKCNKKVQKRKSQKPYSAHEHSRDSDVNFSKSKDFVNFSSQADDQFTENQQSQEMCDAKLLKKADDFQHGKVKDEKVTQVQLHDKIISTKEKRELLKLPKSSEKRDKTMHINEWRKSSHLPCLWRHSLDLDSNMPKYKSNSLADLPRSPMGFDGSPGKRRSLSSRHEGYLLRKNSNRDSAYEDEEEMLEYQDCKSLSAEQCRLFTPKHLNDTNDTFKITYMLKRQERIDSQSAESEEKLELLGPATKMTRPSSKRGSDKESGISSENFFTGD